MSADTPPPSWYDEPEGGPLCPACAGNEASLMAKGQVQDILYNAGVSAKAMTETVDSAEALALFDFVREDVEAATRREGGVTCEQHQPSGD